MPEQRPPPFAPSSYEPRSPIPLPSPIYDDTRYPSTPPPSAPPPEFENEDEFNDLPIMKPSAPDESEFNDLPVVIKPSAPPESEFDDVSPVVIKPSAPTPPVPIMELQALQALQPSAPPESEFDDVSPVVIKPSAPTPPVPIMELQALQALQPSAPPRDLTYFQDQLNLIEEETNNLKLALIESELEYILREISKLNEDECDKQCQETIQPHTLEEFLIKNMNDIFKEK